MPAHPSFWGLAGSAATQHIVFPLYAHLLDETAHFIRTHTGHDGLGLTPMILRAKTLVPNKVIFTGPGG